MIILLNCVACTIFLDSKRILNFKHLASKHEKSLKFKILKFKFSCLNIGVEHYKVRKLFKILTSIQISSLFLPIFKCSCKGKLPESAITHACIGLLLSSVSVSTILCTTSIPVITFPNTTCIPSSHLVFSRVIKNWEPLVSLPWNCMFVKYFEEIFLKSSVTCVGHRQ